jgi:hypothetical protein
VATVERGDVALLSVRAYARHRKERGLPGASHTAVQKAIKAGRIRLTEGKVDPDDADRLWRENTDEGQRRGPAYESPPPSRPSLPPPADGDPVPNYQEARARREAAEAALAEIELAEKRLELVPAKDVEARLVKEHSQAKTKLLGVPARARHQDPSLTPEHLALFEDLIREALNDLATPDAIVARVES